MLGRIKTYTKNLLKYMKSGGVVLINFDKVSPGRRFEGKCVLVTGGGSGIGFETAKEYLAEGAEVIITGRREAALQEASRQLASDRLHTMVWDVSDVKIIPQKLQEAKNLLGRGKNIDIFVNNAGVYAADVWSKYDEITYDRVMATNTKGLFFMCQAEGKYLVGNKLSGRIINVCSIAGIKSGFDPYSVSKWGAVCITKGLAKELAKHGIIVNGVAPGNVVTNIHSGVRGKNVEDNAYMPSHLTGRYTLVEEIAGMILYLSSGLGSNIVGEVVPVDGGWTLK